VSTEDYEDPVTSRARQLGHEAALAAGCGQIVAVDQRVALGRGKGQGRGDLAQRDPARVAGVLTSRAGRGSDRCCCALDTVGQFADEPRPPESFPYGWPDLRRLRADGTASSTRSTKKDGIVQIDHVARLP
jgi:hypothetical protein